VETEWDGEKPPTDNYKSIEDIPLNHNTRYLRFWRDGDAWGYHQIANITVNPAQYIESTLPKDGSGRDLLDFGDVRVGTTKDLSVRINYTNAKSDLHLAIANTTDFSIISEPDIEIADCGAKGYADVTVRCHPMNAGPLSTTMTVTDAVANKSLTINITASISRAPQVILWEPARTEFYTVETSAFQAALPLVTDKGVDVSLASSATDIVSFTGQTATIHEAGEVTITVSQTGTPNYEAAVSVSKNFTINITPTAVETAPTIENAVAGTALGSLVIDASSAVVNNTITNAAVAGTFSVQSGEIGSVGTRTVTLLFTPTESEKYTTCTCEVDVEILPKAVTFNNGSGDSKWETDGNWSVAGVDENSENSAVTIAGHLVIDEEVAVYSLNLENAKALVTIAPNGGLTVGAGGVVGATTSNFILKADSDPESATVGQTGYLRISPEYTSTMPNASVELYSVGYYDRNDTHENVAAWQYIGAPIDFEGALAKTVFTNSWLYSYNESTDSWVNNKRTLVMAPFTGYATTQTMRDSGIKITYGGKLTGNQTVTIDLDYKDAAHGHNMVANSFAAPIDIMKFSVSDFVNAERTIYLFNTGSKSQAEAHRADNTSSGDDAGQYRTIAIGTASEMATAFAGDPTIPTTIAAMQGFWVNAQNSNAQLILDYERLVWNGDYESHPNKPLRAPKRAIDNEAEMPVRGNLKITLSADGWADNVYFLESERYSEAYEDGYDAHKMESGNLNIYAMADEEKLAIDATNSIIGTRVGVRTGSEEAYTLTFSHVDSEDELVLWDKEAEEKVTISEGQTYTFFAEPNSEITSRFVIIEANEADAPSVTTGVEETTSKNAKVHKFIKDDKLYILKNGVLYDATGMRVR